MRRTTPALIAAILLLGGVAALTAQDASPQPEPKKSMHVRYLEIVTPEVARTCDLLGEAHGVTFSDAVPELGDARTADTAGGGRIGVRAPMHEGEKPVVRPYLLVDDVDAAIEAAREADAQVLVPPTDIPGQGRFAIYMLGEIEHGLWER